jgi:hypothetical protein
LKNWRFFNISLLFIKWATLFLFSSGSHKLKNEKLKFCIFFFIFLDFKYKTLIKKIWSQNSLLKNLFLRYEFSIFCCCCCKNIHSFTHFTVSKKPKVKNLFSFFINISHLFLNLLLKFIKINTIKKFQKFLIIHSKVMEV